MSGTDAPTIRLASVDLVRDDRLVLEGVDWQVGHRERWVVLGPNGSGKTTLLRVAGAQLCPTRGEVEILGKRVGSTDLRDLRARIAFVSGSLLRALDPTFTATEIIMTGKFGWLNPWGRELTERDESRARRLLAQAGLRQLADMRLELLSEGERQQVLLTRAMMCSPELILMDEPAAGLDVGARELLVSHLAKLAASRVPAMVFVTHHVEEIPPGFTHLVLLREGRVFAAGDLTDILTVDNLSSCFGIPLDVVIHEGRYSCHARNGGRVPRPEVARTSRRR